ncbi:MULTISPECIES: hypothetical protein [Bradyrhizobium]|jgi:hypothetical protein|uniref:hypothetical protein n=1 Tax=Bradyrhizobium TaxID=374 RepID=UPI0012BBE3F4|nr:MULTISPECIES: hypothetical protein [Bradyrhizobium]MCS3445630.1 hypothetical protein [Bradyrhizobium elkanii]MCS3563239.1 hypothetical protein [Bradyrhizobium elkanii]MCW2146926.1 hypothetical protein [Bradyrhizobium elkanii]MCW2353998.1 hypothetical protein [Bradyrhizobium elkanii]MCW2379756.1 hypothetical protein [Bradyrhizobium elkanii]
MADHLAHHPSGTARCRNNPIGAALPGESVNDYKRKKISYVADDILPRGECKRPPAVTLIPAGLRRDAT